MPILKIYPYPAHRKCGKVYCRCLDGDINQLLLVIEYLKLKLDEHHYDYVADKMVSELKHPNIHQNDSGFITWYPEIK